MRPKQYDGRTDFLVSMALAQIIHFRFEPIAHASPLHPAPSSLTFLRHPRPLRVCIRDSMYRDISLYVWVYIEREGESMYTICTVHVRW